MGKIDDKINKANKSRVDDAKDKLFMSVIVATILAIVTFILDKTGLLPQFISDITLNKFREIVDGLPNLLGELIVFVIIDVVYVFISCYIYALVRILKRKDKDGNPISTGAKVRDIIIMTLAYPFFFVLFIFIFGIIDIRRKMRKRRETQKEEK